MFEYLNPKDGPVIDGLEQFEVVYAKDQPQYLPLRTLRSCDHDGRVLSRWSLTEQQRKAIADGADIFLELMTFNHPLQPILMAVSDGPNETYFANRYGLPSRLDRDANKIPVHFITNGTEHLVECDPDCTLAAIADTLVKSGKLYGDPLAYEFRNRSGVLLENSRTVGWYKQAHFCEGSEYRTETPDIWRVFASLPAGVGG